MEQWAQFFGQVLGTAAIVALGLRKRKTQNNKLNSDLSVTMVREVALIRDQVSILQNIVMLHKEELRLVSDREAKVIGRIGELENALPKIEEVLKKTMSFFERDKKTLETKPLSGGMTAIKPRKG